MATEGFAHTLALALIERHGLTGWSFTLHSRTSAVGMAHYARKELSIAAVLLPSLTDDEVEQVLLHEVAHALRPNSKHDRMWLATARSIGYRGARQHELSAASQQLLLPHRSKKESAVAPDGTVIHRGARVALEGREWEVVELRTSKALLATAAGDHLLVSFSTVALSLLDAAEKAPAATPKTVSTPHGPVTVGDTFLYGTLGLVQVIDVKRTNGHFMAQGMRYALPLDKIAVRIALTASNAL
jgi:hypothetical protein